MEKDAFVQYWLDAATGDFELARSLFETKRYSYSLFFLHLTIEKLLKGLIVARTEEHPPYQHNLVRLAEVTTLSFSEEQLDLLADITTFNIKGRYDDYKNQFYKIATREYTQKYFDDATILIIWLQNNFPKK